MARTTEAHRTKKLLISFRGLGLALFSGSFQVGGLIIRSNNHYLSTILLKLSNLAIAEFRAPVESWGVIAFEIVERPVGMKSRHVLTELVNMTRDDYASLTLRH